MMGRLERSMVIVTILFSSSAVDTFEKSKNFQLVDKSNGFSSIYYPENFITDGGVLIYSKCDHTFLPKEAHCMMIAKSMSEKSPTRRMKYRITPEEDKKLMEKDAFTVGLEPLGDPNKILITWIERDNLTIDTEWISEYQTIAILDMFDGSLKRLQFASSLQRPTTRVKTNIVLYENEFDVVTDDKAHCKDSNWWTKCWIRFDKDAKRVTEPMKFPSTMRLIEISSISRESDSNGFFVVGQSLPTALGPYIFGASQVSAKGKNITFRVDETTENSTLFIPTISTTHQHLTFCIQRKEDLNYDKPIVRCKQFTLNQVEAKISSKFKVPKELEYASAFNLPGGGFILLTLGCDDKSNPNSCKFRIARINSKDQKSMSTAWKFQCTGDHDLAINFKKVKDEYCFYFLCHSKIDKSSLSQETELNYHERCISFPLHLQRK
ncbi:hypothetical protein QAD02_022859 [Eretmocerus hayati]|uniref:Uncharacterized protein n=1 Tax=Eretmocerus hayati TaxID=131215 RepID=A0ACC2PUG1_9HYME|nr:hypothetical protein QAD02_022859 [Eretmocerus hayati]